MRLPAAPVYGHGCLVDQDFGSGTCAETLRVPDWLREPDGRTTVGALALLADSATGWSVSTALAPDLNLVTANLRLDVLRPLGTHDRTFGIVAITASVDDQVGYTTAVLRDGAHEVVALATMRSAHVVQPGVKRPGPRTRTFDVDHHEVRARSVDELFTVGAVDGAHHEHRVRARRDMANATGAVHGGILVVMAERAIVDCLAQEGDPALMRPLTIDIEYRRPLRGDDTEAIAAARIAHATRRFVQVAATVRLPDGRHVVDVRADYARPDRARADPANPTSR